MRSIIRAGLFTLVCCFCINTASAQDERTGNSVVDDEEKHIYDSSERYFNAELYDYWWSDSALWKSNTGSKDVKEMKAKDDFWYVSNSEDFTHFVDSMVMAERGKNRKMPSTRELYEASEAKESGPSVNIGRIPFFALAIIIFIAALVYFMFSNQLAFFAPANVEVNTGDKELMEENLFAMPYKDLLQKALKENNYRVAVRILYLQTLRLLSDNNYIRYQPDYTNIDYLVQLQSQSPDRYRQFAVITSHYEYVWYGKFEVSKELYDRISGDFITLQNNLVI